MKPNITCLAAAPLALLLALPLPAEETSLHMLDPDLVREAVANNPDFYARHHSIPCYRTVDHVCVTRMHWDWMHAGARQRCDPTQRDASDRQRPCPGDASTSYAWRPD